MGKIFQLNRNSGFSLVELMVSVGIIGILATVAVPQYNKFTARAKQSEAKVQLGSIYTVEKAFFVESQKYSSCLSGIGYGAEGNSRRYTVGFGDAANSSVGSLTCPNTSLADGTHFFKANSGAQAGSSGFTDDTLKAQDSAFKAGAKGDIGKNSANSDVWTIDANQDLKNSTSGI